LPPLRQATPLREDDHETFRIASVCLRLQIGKVIPIFDKLKKDLGPKDKVFNIKINSGNNYLENKKGSWILSRI
jgi:hypothetical protein